MLAAVHLAPAAGLAVAALLVGALALYWRRLGRPGVPRSRRLIRRLSIGIMLLAIAAMVRGTCFVDGATSPREYVVVWTIAVVLVGIVILTALVDAVNNIRVHVHDSAHEFRDLVERRDAGAAGDKTT